jgi:hypothetical protein
MSDDESSRNLAKLPSFSLDLYHMMIQLSSRLAFTLVCRKQCSATFHCQ